MLKLTLLCVVLLSGCLGQEAGSTSSIELCEATSGVAVAILPRQRDEQVFDFDGFDSEHLKVKNQQTSMSKHWEIDEEGCSRGTVWDEGEYRFTVIYKSSPDAPCYWSFAESAVIEGPTVVQGELKRVCS